MIDPNLIAFVWSAITSGVIGNVAYDGIKLILGKGFDRLASYAKENKESEFEIALLSILETNEKIAQELSQLREGVTNIQQQKHSGTGDNIGRDKIINITQVSASSQTVKYNLTDKQKNALKELVEIGRTWRNEFFIIWFPPDDINDILDYPNNPPQVSKGDVRILGKENLLECEFSSDQKAYIILIRKSYEAVETNFQETATTNG
jgi:hypothetical protein